MLKRLLIALGAVSLVGAAVAVASVFTAAGVSTTSAALTTGKASDARARTCTGGDGKSFSVVDGRFSGTADFSNPAGDLDGALTLRTRTTVDTGSKLGWLEGSFRVKDGNARVNGRLTGTVDSSATPWKIAGFLTASSRGNHARILGVVNGTFDPNGGYVLNLGSAPASSALAVIAGPVCRGSSKAKPPHGGHAQNGKRFEIHGTLNNPVGTAAGQTVAVTGKGPTTSTCTIDSSSPSTSGFNPGDKVEMKCESVNGTWMLRKLEKHH